MNRNFPGPTFRLFSRLNIHEQRLTKLERLMATEQELITRLDAVTSGMATDIGDITSKIKALQSAVSSGDTAAVSAAMDRLSPSVTKLESLQTDLAALGSDPANPVPAAPAGSASTDPAPTDPAGSAPTAANPAPQ